MLCPLNSLHSHEILSPSNGGSGIGKDYIRPIADEIQDGVEWVRS